MSVQAACPCGARFLAKDELAGRVVRCPTCGKNFQVPALRANAGKTFKVRCRCGKDYQVPLSMAGRAVECQACHQQFVVPHPPGTVKPAPAKPAPIASSPAADPLADLGSLGDLSSFGDPLGGSMPMPSATFPQTYGIPAAAARPKKKRAPLKKSTMVTVALSSLVVLAIIGIGIAGFTFYPRLLGYRSPQAVWEANKKAVMDQDWKAIYDTVTPETQEEIVLGLLVVSQFAVAQQSELAEILKKHGVEPPAAPPDLSSMTALADFGKASESMRANVKLIKNRRAFYMDMMNFLIARGEEMNNKNANPAFATQMKEKMKEAMDSVTLKEVVIEGDDARGVQTVSVMGRTIESPITFKRINGSWLIHKSSAAALNSGVPAGI